MPQNAAPQSRLFTRAEFESGNRKLLRNGHSANAEVWLFRHESGEWTVKDFSNRSWFVRKILAPFLFWRELKAVRLLTGVPHVPSSGFRIDQDAIAVEFIPGKSLSSFPEEMPEDPDDKKPEKLLGDVLTVPFLEEMERLMRDVHEAGLVHLDARGTGNWVVTPDGHPGLIDFQAGLCTKLMPRGVRKILEDVDMSGVLKKWHQIHPDEMGKDRARRFERGSRYRSFWRIRGYFGRRK